MAQPDSSRRECRAWPRHMGDGIWHAECVVCGWRGEATSDIGATWEANNHGPKPSPLSLEAQQQLGLERRPDVVQTLVERSLAR